MLLLTAQTHYLGGNVEDEKRDKLFGRNYFCLPPSLSSPTSFWIPVIIIIFVSIGIILMISWSSYRVCYYRNYESKHKVFFSQSDAVS